MQRRAARIGRVGIGAVLEQHARQFVMGVDDRQRQGARVVGAGVVHVRARREQRAHGVDMSAAHREQQRREPAAGPRLDVGACRGELGDRRGVAFAAAHISAVCPCHVSRAWTFAPRVEQRLDGVDPPVRAAAIRAVSPFGGGRVRIGSGVEQAGDDRGVAGRRGDRQRHDPVAIGSLDIRATRDERLHDRGVLAFGRQMQRRRSVAQRQVGIGALLDEPQSGGQIA